MIFFVEREVCLFCQSLCILFTNILRWVFKMLDRTGKNRIRVLTKCFAYERITCFQLADLVKTFVEFFRIEDLDERFVFF